MRSRLASFVCFILCPVLACAQPIRTDGGRHSDVRIAVPFLLIAPDARAAGMGDAGVATPPSAYAMHWNAAKYAFAPSQAAIGLSFTPWLRQLADDISLSYLSGYAKLGTRRAVRPAWRLFSHLRKTIACTTTRYAIRCVSACFTGGKRFGRCLNAG